MRMVMHRRDELLVCGDDSGLASHSEVGTVPVDRAVAVLLLFLLTVKLCPLSM